MTVWEFYGSIKGDFNRVIDLFENEEIALGFVKMFLEDDSFYNIHKAIDSNDWKLAFRYAHSLKGVCTNMSFGVFTEQVKLLTEALRNETRLDDWSIVEEFDEAYYKIIELIKMID